METSFILKNTPKANASLPPTPTNASTSKEPESGVDGHAPSGREETDGEGGGRGHGGEESGHDMWASLEERDEEEEGFR